MYQREELKLDVKRQGALTTTGKTALEEQRKADGNAHRKPEGVDRHGKINLYITRFSTGHGDFNAFLYTFGNVQTPESWYDESPRDEWQPATVSNVARGQVNRAD